jgi:hypothetical protein
MTVIIIEYCKLFMVFLLIGTIIGLSSIGNRAYRHGTHD